MVDIQIDPCIMNRITTTGEKIMALKMKSHKLVTFRKPEYPADYESQGKPCECCGRLRPYGQKLKMLRCNMRDSYLNTNIYLCIECISGKSVADIESMGIFAITGRKQAIATIMANTPNL